MTCLLFEQNPRIRLFFEQSRLHADTPAPWSATAARTIAS